MQSALPLKSGDRSSRRLRMWGILITLVIFLPIERSTAQTDSQPPSGAVDKEEAPDHATPSTRSVPPMVVLPDAPQPGKRLNDYSPDDEPRNGVFGLPQALLHDQIGIWTSPRNARLSDATWLAPLGGFTAALLATDSDISRHPSNAPDTLQRYRHISDYGVYSMAGGAGCFICLDSWTTTNTSARQDS